MLVGSIGSAGSGPRYPADMWWNEAVTEEPAGTETTSVETGWTKPVLQMISFDATLVTAWMKVHTMHKLVCELSTQDAADYEQCSRMGRGHQYRGLGTPHSQRLPGNSDMSARRHINESSRNAYRKDCLGRSKSGQEHEGGEGCEGRLHFGTG